MKQANPIDEVHIVIPLGLVRRIIKGLSRGSGAFWAMGQTMLSQELIDLADEIHEVSLWDVPQFLEQIRRQVEAMEEE